MGHVGRVGELGDDVRTLLQVRRKKSKGPTTRRLVLIIKGNGRGSQRVGEHQLLEKPGPVCGILRIELHGRRWIAAVRAHAAIAAIYTPACILHGKVTVIDDVFIHKRCRISEARLKNNT